MACPYGGGAASFSHESQATFRQGPGVAPAGAAAQGEKIIGSKPGQLTYGSYLKVPELLSLQELESTKNGAPAHDELLFITIHQTYELWFKQILFEVDSVAEIFSASTVAERSMLTIVQRLTRVVEILKILVAQVTVLETMTPLGFMEFRDFLAPASGFQSMQFRLFENKLGLKQANRIKYHQAVYTAALSPEDAASVEQTERDASLLSLVEKWLERTPGLEKDGFDFWTKYETATRDHLKQQRAHAEACENPDVRNDLLKEAANAETVYNSILDPVVHQQLVESGDRRFSHDAFKGAMMIFLYRDEPLFHLPFSMLQLLQEIDAQVMKWRHSHVTMVQRMIGSKAGTGGSSGYQYLRSTVADRYKVFLDLFNLSTFIIPRKLIPVLDDETRRRFAHSM